MNTFSRHCSLKYVPAPSFLHSDESYVIGFVVPNQKQLLALAEKRGVQGTWLEICNSPVMEEEVLKTITDTAIAGEP